VSHLIKVDNWPGFKDKRHALLLGGPLLQHAITSHTGGKGLQLGGPLLRHVMAGESQGEYAPGRQALVLGEISARYHVRIEPSPYQRQALLVGGAHWKFALRDDAGQDERQGLGWGALQARKTIDIDMWSWAAYRARNGLRLGTPEIVGTLKADDSYWAEKQRHALALAEPVAGAPLEVRGGGWMELQRRALAMGQLQASTPIKDSDGWWDKRQRHAIALGGAQLPIVPLHVTEQQARYALAMGPLRGAQVLRPSPHDRHGMRVAQSLPPAPRILVEKGAAIERQALQFGSPAVQQHNALQQIDGQNHALSLGLLSLPLVPRVLQTKIEQFALKLGKLPGAHALLPKDATSARCAVQLGFTAKEQTTLEQAGFTVPANGKPHYFNRALAFGAPMMEHHLRVRSGIVKADGILVNYIGARRAIQCGIPQKVYIAPPDILGDIYHFPIFTSLGMPWGQTLVSGLVRTQQIINTVTGEKTDAGAWEFLNGQWAHDGFGNEVTGGGSWQITEFHEDGSASGTVFGGGEWGSHIPAEVRIFYHEVLQISVETHILYTGGTWGFTGTWSIGSSGALSWEIVINKGSGARIGKIFLRGNLPDDSIFGEGFETEEVGGSGSGSGSSGFTILPDDYLNGSDFDFQSLPEDDLESLLGKLYSEAKRKKGKGSGSGSDSGSDSGSGSGSGSGSDSGSGSGSGISASGGAQLIGPVPSIVLPAPPAEGEAERRVGTLQGIAPTVSLTDTLHIEARADAHQAAFLLVHTRLHVADNLQASSSLALRDTLHASGRVGPMTTDARLQEVLRVQDAVQGYASTQDRLAERLHVDGRAQAASLARVFVSLHVQDAVRADTVLHLQESLHLDSRASAFTRRPDVLLRETLHCSERISGNGLSWPRLATTVHVRESLFAPDAAATCWVMTLGTHAVYFWDNWQFTDMLQIDGKIFAAGPNGLMLMDADSDNGRPIAARVQYGFSELAGQDNDGATLKKRVPHILAGYTAQQPLQLTCETYGQNWPVYRYTMPAAPAAQPINNRITIGKGLNARYWRFAIENTQGGDFTLHSLEAEVLYAQRRL